VSALRKAREREGLSQEQLAARLRREGIHVDRSAISYWERRDAIPDDLRPVLARILRAPELLPSRGMVFDDPPTVSLGWVREEIGEAAQVVDRICEMLRRSEDPRELEIQLWDLYTALDSYFAARCRYDGVDLGWYEETHRRKVLERHGRRQAMAVA